MTAKPVTYAGRPCGHAATRAQLRFSMDAETLLLDLWRMLGRRGLLESLPDITDRLIEALPLSVLELGYLDSSRRILVTLASSRQQSPSRRLGYGTERFGRLQDWCREGELRHLTPNSRWPEELAPLAPAYEQTDVLIGPLRVEGELSGIAILAARSGTVFSAAHEDIAARILEPLAVALRNELGRRELSSLRAAAGIRRSSPDSNQDEDDTLVGSSDGLRSVMERVDLVAGSDTSVLLLGETGSGKEVIARAVHERSLRREGPFIRVNCGAIPAELIDSELFGHEKGSFTGAAAQRKGWFERADGGTLFLDEIGELPPAAQVRLLRVLQDGTLYRVGGEVPIQVDVRVVAATHRDLAAMVGTGCFRQDLWYRIAVFPILIPPLRERQSDIPALARHFGRRASMKLGLPLQLPSDEDIALLRRYPWPGNVRELAAVLERAAILGNGAGLQVAAALGVSPLSISHQPHSPVRESTEQFMSLDEAMAAHIRAALRRTQGRIEGRYGAAALLRINPHTLRARMRKLGITAGEFRKIVSGDPAGQELQRPAAIVGAS